MSNQNRTNKTTKTVLCGATAALFIAAAAGAAHAQNGGTNKNAPPRHDATGAATQKAAAQALSQVGKPQTIIAAVWQGKVTEVLNANTLRVEKPGKNGSKTPQTVLVRLWGVAAPTGTDANAAKDYVEKSVKGKTVRVQAQSRDKSGVLLADVFALPYVPPFGVPQGRLRRPGDSTVLTRPRPIAAPDVPANFPNLNEGLVRAGLVRWNKAEAPEATNLSGAQAEAQKNKVGVWAASIE